MNFFIVKKPAFIDFFEEKYKGMSTLKNRHYILFNGKDSNSKLIKLTNGKYYIRYGNVMIELKGIETRQFKIAQVEDKDGKFLETNRTKWFLQNTHMNMSI